MYKLKQGLGKIHPLILFSPFLIVYILFIVKFNTGEIAYDELRYVELARNLLKGFYSPPPPDINLWSGPGYPLFLSPFLFFNVPVHLIKLLNAFLLYGSVILLFLSCKNYVPAAKAFLMACCWGSYLPAFQTLPSLLTETYVIFLISLFIFYLQKTFQHPSKKTIVISGVLLGLIVLTKIVFGYVLVVLLLVTFICLLIKRDRINKSVLSVFVVALLLNIPYLIYTYSITGKVFYWGNSGGLSLYWMSTPYENEYGDWNNTHLNANFGNDTGAVTDTTMLFKNHAKELTYINQLPKNLQDDALKKIAISNIKNYPVKFVRNCIANVSRMFFGVPMSYVYQKDKTIIRFFYGSILFVLMLCSGLLCIYHWRKTIPFYKWITGFIFIYLGAGTFLSAYPRQLYIIIPVVLLWSTYIFSKTIVLHIRPNKTDDIV